ncbi:MAG TPA: alkaline phosphatase family protein [Acidimicrobiales bacterium]|nr:alkaline phosphatase family protein [Acidimicrobiales bacterium]
MSEHPVLPSYDGACITNLVPALLRHDQPAPAWLPAAAVEAPRVVLLVIDGLGWNQLATRRRLTPALSALEGGRITTVAPSTTATALTSISTGLPPGEHGVVGYRMAVHGEVLNVLRWATAAGDARQTIPPAKMQLHSPFEGHRPPVVTRAEFAGSGFTLAHLEDTRFTGYRTLGTLVSEVVRLSRAGEPFVYAYYEGIDKVSHEYGLGGAYDEELAWVDHLVARLLEELPAGTALVVTADHGQVETGDDVQVLPGDVLTHVASQSGEGRFRWLHARGGRGSALLAAARDLLGDHAWVRSRQEAIAEGWYGPVVTDAAAGRLGDVLLAAKGTTAFHDPLDTGPYVLVGRHGSLTEDEMLVPLLVGVAR